MKIDELIFQILKENNGGSIPSIYKAIHVILSSDDNRVLASQVSRLFVEVYFQKNLYCKQQFLELVLFLYFMVLLTILVFSTFISGF